MPPVSALFVTDEARVYYAQALIECRVPEPLREGLIMYLVDHVPTGSFLQAVLSNDLHDACRRADEHNRYRLFDIVYFLHNHAPGMAWGSVENVTRWLTPIRHSKEDCDESCTQCEYCYRASGDSGCNKLCRHRFVNYPNGWPEDE